VADDMVMMTHPDAGDAGPVTRQAFDTVWADLGWTIKPDDEDSKPARKSRAKTSEEQA
jgi:hypothetical protein